MCAQSNVSRIALSPLESRRYSASASRSLSDASASTSLAWMRALSMSQRSSRFSARVVVAPSNFMIGIPFGVVG